MNDSGGNVKVVIAPDSYKESLAAPEVARQVVHAPLIPAKKAGKMPA